MAIGLMKVQKKNNNRKIIAGAVIATTAAAGTAVASTKGRAAIRKMVGGEEPAYERTDMLSTWLKDAHAMEEAQIKTLKGMIKDFKDDQMIVDKLNHHLITTEKQKKDVEKCLKMLGEKPAKSKQILGMFAGLGPAIDTKLFKDKKVKDMLMLHSGEHFEHASYVALAAAAEAAGKKNMANIMNRIAGEEKEMAEWIEKNLAQVVKKHLKS